MKKKQYRVTRMWIDKKDAVGFAQVKTWDKEARAPRPATDDVTAVALPDGTAVIVDNRNSAEDSVLFYTVFEEIKDA